jgi:hypothetical protein
MDEIRAENLTDAEIALMDAIKTVLEVIMTAGVAKAPVFEGMFSYQRDVYLAKRQPTSAAVMELLRRFADDPERKAHREMLRTLIQESPKGSA